MKKLICTFVLVVVAGCSPRPELPPETVEAYQADNDLRAMTLKKCNAHVVNHTPFATQGDSEECRKASTAQANVGFAAYEHREREGDARAAQEINALAGERPSGKP